MENTQPTRNPYLAQLKNINFGYNDKPIFTSINLNIKKGQITAIMGPSGCGKTTLLHLMTGFNIPNKGHAIVFGQNIEQLSRAQLFQIRQRMGMLFQSAALFLDLNVFDNVAFPLRELNILPESMIQDIVLLKLEAVGLRGAKSLAIQNLSGGMKRRIALARAIACDPNLLLLDEPFAGQDPVTMGVLTHLINLINKSFKTTIVLVSHTIQNTFQIADYIYLVSEGRIMGEGAPQELLRNHDPWIQQFIKGFPDGPMRFHYPSIPLKEELRV